MCVNFQSKNTFTAGIQMQLICGIFFDQTVSSYDQLAEFILPENLKNAANFDISILLWNNFIH